VTVAAFYAAHAVQGRAVLEGPAEHPLRWIVADGRDFYLCERTTVLLVRGDDPLPRGRAPWELRRATRGAQQRLRPARATGGHSLGA
jgi:hypothetical protein